jgi:cytochrome oxidase Cu insertion factor (SCO1/SenC/PrrC family)
MSDVDLALSRRLPWGLLVLALLLPVVLGLRDLARSRAVTAAGAKASELGDFGAVPDFSLTERSGRELKRSDLAGAPWIADFVYTTCAGTCPLLSSDMARLHLRVGDRVRLVSFTVDPARDSPQALAAYADRFGASPTGWLFATGPVETMRQLISQGFHLAVVDPPAGDPELSGVITHSEKVVLVDAGLRIRRYYDAGSRAWLDAAVADLAKLGAGPLRAAQ